MSSYRIAAPADKDIDAILKHIAKEAGIETGLGVVSELLDAFRLLGQQPRAGRLLPEFGKDTRRFPCGKYLIYYRVRKRWIEVMHVFHGAQDQKKAWKRH